MDERKNLAEKNLALLGREDYHGRWVIIGLDKIGENLIQIYGIEGRSPESRNRVLVHNPALGSVETLPANVANIPENSDLLFYRAMVQIGEAMENDVHIITNGNQTDTILNSYCTGGDFYSALLTRNYEPDTNHTPRISAMFNHEGGKINAEMSILKKSEFNDSCDRYFYQFGSFAAGYGYCITTYSGNGNPLPPFSESPLLVPLEGDINGISEFWWDILDENNRVSLAVKSINVKTGKYNIKIINKYSRVEDEK